MKVPLQSRNRRNEQGYILLTLLLFVTILIISLAIVVPEITFQVKRDREEEMIHRGVQYSRAIRRYVKQLGRYPTRIEDLENTNNQRFLRRRYKDPITGKDFKLLHVGEVQMMPGSALAGATPVSAMPGALGQPQQSLNQPAQPQPAKNDENKDDQSGDTQQSDQPKGATNAGGDALSGQVFGGGPIVGVASTSKAQTIREFNHKNHYNQWQFIYDPASDRGGLLNTPAQPPLQGAIPQAGAPVPGTQSPQQGQPSQQLSAPPANMPPPTSDQQQQQ